jgi:hypothetical protein
MLFEESQPRSMKVTPEGKVSMGNTLVFKAGLNKEH